MVPGEPERKGRYAHVSGGGVVAASAYRDCWSCLAAHVVSLFPSRAEIVWCLLELADPSKQ
jgi:hypothetical protein